MGGGATVLLPVGGDGAAAGGAGGIFHACPPRPCTTWAARACVGRGGWGGLPGGLCQHAAAATTAGASSRAPCVVAAIAVRSSRVGVLRGSPGGHACARRPPRSRLRVGVAGAGTLSERARVCGVHGVCSRPVLSRLFGWTGPVCFRRGAVGGGEDGIPAARRGRRRGRLPPATALTPTRRRRAAAEGWVATCAEAGSRGLAGITDGNAIASFFFFRASRVVASLFCLRSSPSPAVLPLVL